MKALGKNYNQLTDEDKESIVSLFMEGKQYSEIIEIVGTTRRAVPKVIREAGIQARRKNRYTLNEQYFDNIDTPEQSYWLGMVASDGCITETNYFAISLVDKDVLDKLKADLEYTGEVYQTTHVDDGYNRQPTYRINFSSKPLCDALRRIGIKECKSLSFNEIPSAIPKEFLRDFIRGYFDGDGSIFTGKVSSTVKGKYYEYITWQAGIIATPQLCRHIHNVFLDEFDYDCPLHTSKTDGMNYVMVYDNKVLTKLYSYMYDNASRYMQRKHDKWQDCLSAIAEQSTLKKKVN